MKFNISYPFGGVQKKIEIDDEKKIAIFYGKKMGNEVRGDELGDQYKGYIFRITGGNDKDGFTMKQGILVNGRVRLLLQKGSKNYRPRRAGERKRKSVRGCIVGPDISVLALAIVKRGEKDIDGLTTVQRPNRLHVKRASKIRKLYNLTKEDDVKFYVSKVGREVDKKKDGTDKKKKTIKRPKIQRLITDVRIRRKKIEKSETKKRRERTSKLKEEYHKVVQKWHAKLKAKHAAEHEPVKAEPKKEEKVVPKGKTAPVKATDKGKVDPKATTKAAPAKEAPKKVEAPKKEEPKKSAPVAAKTGKK